MDLSLARVKSVNGLLPLTSYLLSRSLHAAACALVAAIGFIGLATLPPDAYLVCQGLPYFHVWPSHRTIPSMSS